MAYKNIVFIKLEKRLLNDWRFYMMSELSQLNFLRLLMLAGETYNKIPLSKEAIKLAFRTSQDANEIEKSIKEIMINFPKFKRGKNFYYIEDFHEKTNWLSPKQSLSKRSANAQHAVDKEKEEEKEEEKEKERARPSLDDLKAFFKDQDLANRFFDYYQANGWKVGRNTMKDWKAAARNWQRRQSEFSKNGNPKNLSKGQLRTQASFEEFKKTREYEKKHGRNPLFEGHENPSIALPGPGV